MVRKVICGATLVLLLLPSIALAEPDGTETTEVPAQTVYQVDSPDYTSRLDTLTYNVQNVNDTGIETRNQVVQHLITIEGLLKPVENTEPVIEEQPVETEEVKQLKGLNDKLDGITELLEVEEVPTEQDSDPIGQTRGTKNFTAYGNVSPTGTYAQYALGYLPRVGFKEHYCFVQDTQNSYTFVWGELGVNNGSISGQSDWVRFYYTQANGYLMESGHNDNVTINPNSHVVMSDLEGYPMLGVENELLRKELGFYALVAVAVFSLASVLGFCIRLSSRYS